MPLSSCEPRSSKVSPEPATRSLTVEETSTSPGCALAATLPPCARRCRPPCRRRAHTRPCASRPAPRAPAPAWPRRWRTRNGWPWPGRRRRRRSRRRPCPPPGLESEPADGVPVRGGAAGALARPGPRALPPSRSSRRCPRRGPWPAPGRARPPDGYPRRHRQEALQLGEEQLLVSEPRGEVRAGQLHEAGTRNVLGQVAPAAAVPSSPVLPVHDQRRDANQGKDVAHVHVDVHPDVGGSRTGADTESKDTGNALELLLRRARVGHADDLVGEGRIPPATLRVVGLSLRLLAGRK